MHKIVYAYLFVFGFAAASCTNSKSSMSSLAINFKETKTPPDFISFEDFEKDFEFLKKSLTKAYAGYFFKNRHAVDEGLSKIESTIKQKSFPISRLSFCRWIARSFAHVRDRHLSFQVGSRKCLRKRSEGRVGRRLHIEKKKTWFIEDKIINGNRVLILSITRFPSLKSKKWFGMLRAIQKKLSSTDFVLLDFRGNGGGDDAQGLKLASLLSGTQDLATPYGFQYKVVTKEGLETRANLFKLYAKNSDDLKEKKYLEGFITRDRELYVRSPRPTIVLNPSLPKVVRIQSVKPIFILQDRACGSSCESTIDFFEYIDGVVKIGEPTAGYIHFGNLGFAMLPESQIQVNIPSTFNSYRDHRFIEGDGIKPDIEVPKGKDAFDVAVKLIKQKK